MSLIWCEQAWLPGGPVGAVALEIVDGRIAGDHDRTPPAPAPSCPASPSRAWSTGTRTPSTAPCAATPPARRARSGAGARACTASPPRSTRTATGALATAVYAEMALAGHTAVTEFHYLHHAPGGRPYADPIAMDRALVDAAAAAGLRLTLLDTCYLAVGLRRAHPRASSAASPTPTSRPGRRGRSASRPWTTAPAIRVAACASAPRSTRCARCRARPCPAVAEWAGTRPLHVHLSEQPDENAACLAAHGRTPTALLDEAGALGPATTAVHATHLTDDDVARLARTGTRACFCPTTERDLGDGIGPAGALATAGVPLCLGSDSHAVVDPFEEMRALEMHERLRHGVRERFTPGELLRRRHRRRATSPSARPPTSSPSTPPRCAPRARGRTGSCSPRRRPTSARSGSADA